jgi:4-hydroxybenzoate polyprenyltransferase
MTWAFLVVAVAAAFTAAAALGPAATVAVGLSLAAGAVYSTGPRAKAWPFVGVVTNAIIFVPLCSLLTDVTRTRPALPLLLSCFATLLVQNQLVHELADAEEDRRRGDRTTAIVLGVGGTRLAIAVVSATGAALAWWVCPDWGSLTQATVLVAAATVVAVCGDAARSRRRHRWLSLAGGAALWLCAP